MDKAERGLRAQHVDAGERVERVRGGALVQPGQRGRLARVGVVAEDRDRPRQHRGLWRKAGETERHRARPGARLQLAQAGHVERSRGEPRGGDLVHELAQQQRIAARLLSTSGAERVLGIGRQGLAYELSGRVVAQRGRPEDRGQRVGDDLADERRVLPSLLASEADHHEQVQPVYSGQ